MMNTKLSFSSMATGRYFLLLILMAGALLFTQCGGSDSDSTAEESTPPPAEPAPTIEAAPPVVMVSERKALSERHQTKAPVVEAEPEKYEEPIMAEEVVQAEVQESDEMIVFVPHRTTYVPIIMVEEMDLEAVEPEEVARKLTEYDTPPMYDEAACANKKNPEHCQHMHLQRKLNSSIDMSVTPDDSQDHIEYATFVVKANGMIDPASIRVIDQTPHCGPCSAEAKRVVQTLDKWTPGTYESENVDVQITLPIRFHDFE